MAYEQKNNEGALFKNDKRSKDGDAHATGSATIDGVEYFISAWTNDGKKGKWQKLSFKRKGARQPDDGDSSYGRQPRDMDEDTIPF